MTDDTTHTLIPDTRYEVGAVVLVLAGFATIGASVYTPQVSIWAAVALLITGVATYGGLKWSRLRAIGPGGVELDGEDCS